MFELLIVLAFGITTAALVGLVLTVSFLFRRHLSPRLASAAISERGSQTSSDGRDSSNH